MIDLHDGLGNAGGRSRSSLYQVKITLEGIEPPIWRRLEVPGDAKLDWLHAVIQMAMGWTNSHIHDFECDGKRISCPSFGLDEMEDSSPLMDERKVSLEDLVTSAGDIVTYEYDFGDSWIHRIEVEAVRPLGDSPRTNATCTAGERACPPEDSGGPWGYPELLAALKNKKHPDHRAMKEWLGRPFDSENLSLAVTNDWLKQLKWPHVTSESLQPLILARMKG